MSFKKNLEPEDIVVSSFQVHKTFSFTDADSGSGIYSVPITKGTDSTIFNYNTTDGDSKTISNPSESVFYKVPTYHAINNLYYRNITQMNGYIDLIRGVPTSSEAIIDYTFTRFLTTGSQPQTFKYRRPYTRQLRDTANVLSIPQELFGENIRPSSVKIVDDSTSKTITLRDDGRGNIYDVAFSASYARREPNTNTMSGSVVGNVFYNDGVIVFTDTGSYDTISSGTGTDGFTLEFDSTQTIYERSYFCTIDENKFTHTTNKSLKVGQSGSISFAGTPFTSSVFSNNEDPNFPYEQVGYTTSSFNPEGYNIGTELIGAATHSDFNTYITQIGLYNDQNELLAVGKPSKPIKNEKEMSISFLVKFDTN
jgi:hypothetical protein